MTRAVQAIIFDLDGVLVDSRVAVETAWRAWSFEFAIPFEIVSATIPGRRTRDAITALAPHLDADVQSARIVAAEQHLVHTVVPIAGAAALLAALPQRRWGIATSGTASIARPRLAYAGLRAPDIFVTAEMVGRGKPDPEVYVKAAAALGLDPAQCAVFEDAPDGVAAAMSAGCYTIGVLTWASPQQLGAPVAVRDLRDVAVVVESTQLLLCIETRE
jgi:sugar-phosphatase